MNVCVLGEKWILSSLSQNQGDTRGRRKEENQKARLTVWWMATDGGMRERRGGLVSVRDTLNANLPVGRSVCRC